MEYILIHNVLSPVFCEQYKYGACDIKIKEEIFKRKVNLKIKVCLPVKKKVLIHLTLNMKNSIKLKDLKREINIIVILMRHPAVMRKILIRMEENNAKENPLILQEGKKCPNNIREFKP